MRVLQTITDTDRRGAQVFALDLEAALRARGHEVRTVALQRGRNTQALTVDVLGASRRDAVTALRRTSPGHDVVVAHGSSTLVANALAGLGTRTPFVYRQISDSRFWARSWSRRLRVAAYLRRAAGIVALSEEAASVLVAHVWAPTQRISVVPNGVPAEGFAPATAPERAAARVAFGLAPERPTLLFAAALVEEKGADVAIRALQQLPDAQLLVAGDGSERDRLERLAKEVAPDRVVFAGSLAEVRPAYAAADIVVLPSRGGDSMPATLIEAGFCGLPAVTTDVGSIAEVVLDGETGRVLQPGDDAGTIGAVVEMLADRATMDRMGAAARAHCLARFEIGVVAAGWEAALQRVI